MRRILEGKAALVTGGSRGIGAGIALALAENGADVAISYVVSKEKAEALVRRLECLQVRAAAFQADQADSGQVRGLVAAVAAHFGRLDILVNNAGVAVASPLDSNAADTAALDRQYAINFTAVAAAIRAAARFMSEGGRIISIGSCLASRASFPGLADYAASKAAVVGYSKGAARDLAARKITVNVVQSGPVDTEMNPSDGPTAGQQKAATALGRYAAPGEIAAGVVFLASPAASFVTGSVLDVDGGFGA